MTCSAYKPLRSGRCHSVDSANQSDGDEVLKVYDVG